jgi:hypothetical protein
LSENKRGNECILDKNLFTSKTPTIQRLKTSKTIAQMSFQKSLNLSE